MTKTHAPMDSRARDDIASRPWAGSKRRYDLFKELTVGVVVVGVLVVGLAAVFSSPDEPSITLQDWAKAAPADFVTTAAAELGGTSETAGYGAPYNTTADASQTLGPIDLQSLSGVRIPIDTAADLVTTPLSLEPSPPAGLAIWNAASAAERSAWTAAYSDAIAAAPAADPSRVAQSDAFGPVPAITAGLLAMAQRGALDGAIQNEGGFFNLDYTKSILFLGDGQYFVGIADAAHLTGDQWGMMNETGNYPGQSWLWLFSFWYQVPGVGDAPNADFLVVVFMLVLTVLLALVPLIPGLRSLPRWIPLHKLVWKDYYRKR